MAPTLTRQLCADLANLQLDPVVAGWVVVHVPLPPAEREKAALLLVPGDTAAALAILRRAIG